MEISNWWCIIIVTFIFILCIKTYHHIHLHQYGRICLCLRLHCFSTCLRTWHHQATLIYRIRVSGRPWVVPYIQYHLGRQLPPWTQDLPHLRRTLQQKLITSSLRWNRDMQLTLVVFALLCLLTDLAPAHMWLNLYYFLFLRIIIYLLRGIEFTLNLLTFVSLDIN